MGLKFSGDAKPGKKINVGGIDTKRIFIDCLRYPISNGVNEKRVLSLPEVLTAFHILEE